MKKILLIDDDDAGRGVTAEMLSLANYEVIIAENGKIGILLALEENPDLILCDVKMPELDGHGVLHILGRNPKTAGIPFIFISTKSGKEDARKGMNLGADDYLTKPFEGLELLSSIEARLRKNELSRTEFEWTLTGANNLLVSAKETDRLLKLTSGRKPRKFKKKEIIFLEGDPADSVVFISKGRLKTYKSTFDGKELITGIHNSGNFIGALNLADNKNYLDSASALEDCEVLMIPKQAFYSLIYQDRDLSARFINLLSNHIYQMEERMLNLAYNSVRKRIADGLLLIQKIFGDEGKKSSSFSITRDDLASLVGISPESVSRALHDFVNEGIIRLEEKSVVILNSDKLKSMKN